ncbi:MAG: hypothetical protein CM15mP74_03610 [Halieaceae bacterium]|nr:MAG: hypothetical protein CM15mP74_03610 [Halieaceae bacterium]
MAEFIVSVAFVFLPLFVLVPTLGKLADIQHENPKLAARYVTWERTVWFDNLSGENRDDFSRSGNDWEHVALRSASSVTASMQNRFSKLTPTAPSTITSGDLGTRSPSDQWRYVQSGEAILRDVSVNNFRELNTPGLAYGVTEFFAGAVDTIKSPIDFLLRAVGNENEDLFGFPFFLAQGLFHSRGCDPVEPKKCLGIW